MPRMKRILRRRNAVTEVITTNEEAPEILKPVKVKKHKYQVRCERWNRAYARAHTFVHLPTYGQATHEMTKREFQEWGDALRILRREEFINASSLTLSDMRSVLHSMKVCQRSRIHI